MPSSSRSKVKDNTVSVDMHQIFTFPEDRTFQHRIMHWNREEKKPKILLDQDETGFFGEEESAEEMKKKT